MFTLCVNDSRIFDALLNETIPVIITSDPKFDDDATVDAFPWNIICTPSKAQLLIGNLYRNAELMGKYVKNGQKILNKLLK
jgi:hypothetical protein